MTKTTRQRFIALSVGGQTVRKENMTRREMDLLEVGDVVEVRTYDTTKEEYEWTQTTIEQIFVCADGGKFAHGGKHSVYAKVNGFSVPLDSELTRLP